MGSLSNKQPVFANNTFANARQQGAIYMKATGIVRRIDELGRVVVPKEIRRTLRIREGDPSLNTLRAWERYCCAWIAFGKRVGVKEV